MPNTSSARRRHNRSFRGRNRIPNALQGVARRSSRSRVPTQPTIGIQPVGTPVRLNKKVARKTYKKK